MHLSQDTQAEAQLQSRIPTHRPESALYPSLMKKEQMRHKTINDRKKKRLSNKKIKDL